ncbi:MAG TPA: threonine/serine dehydratase [Vicinamibacteria bacterium]|nr:threonine/serine dehydratase [Vicinamibacteria bacterium]
MLTLEDVLRARDVLRPYLKPTPLRRALCVPSAPVWLKLECWQPTGSFKVRGATNVLASLSGDERARGVVAASAGNHALGVAFAAQALGGVAAALFVPETAPRAKLEKLRRFPVVLHVVGQTYDDAAAAALAHQERTGATHVHAFDDPRTAAGQGTVGLEIRDELPEVGTIVMPVGGGGLVSGIAAAVKALQPDIRIVAVQPEASPSLPESLRRGQALLTFPAAPTLADALAGGIGEIVFAHRHLLDDVVTVSEAEIADAIVALLAEDQVVSEGGGAVGVAAVRAGRVRVLDSRPLAVVVTGGNIDVHVLARLLAARA